MSGVHVGRSDAVRSTSPAISPRRSCAWPDSPPNPLGRRCCGRCSPCSPGSGVGHRRPARHRRRRRRQAHSAELPQDRAAGGLRHRQGDPGPRRRNRARRAGADAHGCPHHRRRRAGRSTPITSANARRWRASTPSWPTGPTCPPPTTRPSSRARSPPSTAPTARPSTPPSPKRIAASSRPGTRPRWPSR